MNIAITFGETCRNCGVECEFKVASRELLDEPDDKLIEALREFGLKQEGWSNGYCSVCLEHRFLDEADKADHDNKCQRELDP
jgi:hypothetical protein